MTAFKGGELLLRIAPYLVTGVVGLALVGGIWASGRADGVRAEAPKTELARDDAGARGLEARGERESAVRAQAAADRAEAATRALNAFVTAARSTGDADAPLDPASTDRLRAHDRELCRISPKLEGCPAGDAAPAADAVDGGQALRALHPAGRPADRDG